MGGQEEEALRRRFRAKGLHLMLKEEMSAVNKKIDVRLKVASLHAFFEELRAALEHLFSGSKRIYKDEVARDAERCHESSESRDRGPQGDAWEHAGALAFDRLHHLRFAAQVGA
jgi:hypothetical protein